MLKPEPKTRKRVLTFVTVIVILQGVILLGLGIFSFLLFQKEYFPPGTAILYVNFQVLAFIITFAGIISIFVLKGFLEREEVEIQTSRLQLKQSKEIIQSLQIQRHDFKNQLSIIKAWAELGDNQSILKYLHEEQNNIKEVEAFGKIRCPVLHALFLVIHAKAKENDIKLIVDPLITLEDFDYPWSKTNRIFSNLLNNAVEAVAAQKPKGVPDREIHVYIWDTEEDFVFQIWTPTQIKHESPECIFLPSVTSKTQSGHGYGLYIVQKLVRELNGRIKVITGEPDAGTEFRLEFRKKVKGFSPRIKSSEQLPGKHGVKPIDVYPLL